MDNRSRRTSSKRTSGEGRKRPRDVEARPRRKRSAELEEDFVLHLSDDVKTIRAEKARRKQNRPRNAQKQDEALGSTSGVRRTSSNSRKNSNDINNSVKNNKTKNNNVRKSKRYRKRVKKKQKQAKNRISKRIGISMAIIQIIASIIFIIAILTLNMLPTRYVAALFGMLVLLAVLVSLGQLFSKKNAIAGKMLSGFMTIILVVSSYYIFQTNGTLSNITGGVVKLNNMVVAVLKDDPAENIQDAAEYTFGVQYSLRGEDTQSAIEAIKKEENIDINVVEYSDMSALAIALQEQEVQAIIYNEAYAGIIEEENSSFAKDIKIIYEHGIESVLSLKTEKTESIKVNDDTFTVYISGIDVYGSINKTSRSDVNILATINPETGQILLVTTPRDYYVTFPNVTNGKYDKLTHAGIYGVDTSVDTLEAIYDVDIDFYARVNFTSLIDMVDALGGITVYSEQSFSSHATPDNRTVYFNEGLNDLNGEEALAFSRERKRLPGGDNQRGINQQAVIVGMVDKATSPAIITGANKLLESVGGNVDTNMTESQIQNLIKKQIDDMTQWNIESIAATGTAANEWCYSYSSNRLYVTKPDEESIANIKEKIQSVYDGQILGE